MIRFQEQQISPKPFFGKPLFGMLVLVLMTTLMLFGSSAKLGVFEGLLTGGEVSEEIGFALSTAMLEASHRGNHRLPIPKSQMVQASPVVEHVPSRQVLAPSKAFFPNPYYLDTDKIRDPPHTLPTTSNN